MRVSEFECLLAKEGKNREKKKKPGKATIFQHGEEVKYLRCIDSFLRIAGKAHARAQGCPRGVTFSTLEHVPDQLNLFDHGLGTRWAQQIPSDGRPVKMDRFGWRFSGFSFSLPSPRAAGAVREPPALWLCAARRLSLKTDSISFARFGI